MGERIGNGFPSPANYEVWEVRCKLPQRGPGRPKTAVVHLQLERTHMMATNCLEYEGMSPVPFGYVTDGGPLAKRMR